MYYPQSQITTGLFSNGDLVYKSNGTIYNGPYYKISSGQLFSGLTPDDINTQELISTSGEKYNTEILSKRNNYDYLIITKSKNLPKTNPLFIQPSPTSVDYDNETFTRFFCKKSNELIYIEIDNITFDQLNNQEDTINWELYIPFSIPWKIKGNKQKVYKTNKSIVEYYSLKLKLVSFSTFLKEDYTKYFKD